MTATISGSATSTLVALTTTGNTILGDASTDTLNVGNGDLVKDASGNVGIGVTPSTSSASSTLFLKNAGQSTYAGPIAYQDVNVVYNSGADRYISNGFATRFSSINGVQAWFNAASGTAGNAITFTQAMTLDSSGNLLVGTTTNVNAARLKLVWVTGGYGIESIASANTISYHANFGNASNPSAGNISTTNNATNYATASDYRLKEDILPMVNALGVVAQLKPVTYKWKNDGSDGQGFIAHELQEVVEGCVTGTKDATREQAYEVTPAVKDEEGNVITGAVMGTRTVPLYQGIDTSFLVATLTAAIQEK